MIPKGVGLSRLRSSVHVSFQVGLFVRVRRASAPNERMPSPPFSAIAPQTDIPSLAQSRNPPTPGRSNGVNNDAEGDAGSRRPSAAGTEAAPVDLLTGDTSTATTTAATGIGGTKGSSGVANSCAGVESHPSPSVSVSSSSTEPLSDSSDTAPMAMSSSSSSSWEDQQHQQQAQDKRSASVVGDKPTVAEIYEVLFGHGLCLCLWYTYLDS